MLHALLPESRVNLGTTLFIQIMGFLSWKRFHRIGARRDGDRYARRFPCAERFRVMAFAQRSYRESLRDLELCLSRWRQPHCQDPRCGQSLNYESPRASHWFATTD